MIELEEGDLVQRLPKFCDQSFRNYEDTIFEVTFVSPSKNKIRIQPAGHKDYDVNIHSQRYGAEKFTFAKNRENAVGSLQMLSHKELIDLELSIEEEWERRSLLPLNGVKNDK